MNSDLEAIEPAEPVVRGMPTNAFGPRSRMTATGLLDFGALAASRGMTRSRVNKFLNIAQTAALRSVLESAEDLLDASNEIAQAKVNEIAARVDRLPRVVVAPQGTWRQMLGIMPVGDGVQYVRLEDVKLVIAEALAATINVQ